MFGFKLWSNFGSFRDPLTITQNLSFPIPPKTKIGGLLASILGIDYNDYFTDEEYFDFQYSLILLNPIRKKSFAQSYITDYTKKSQVKYSNFENYYKSKEKLSQLLCKRSEFDKIDELSESDQEKLLNIDTRIKNVYSDLLKKKKTLYIQFEEKFPVPKPIYRELLINPKYLIFIKDFKYNQEIIDSLKNHKSEFAFYMGNSEFAANFEYIATENESIETDCLDSFTKHDNLISFEPGKKYSNIYAATRTTKNREYKDYKNLIVCDKDILLKQTVNAFKIKNKYGDFNCDFI